MSSKVTDDDHNQLLSLIVINNKIGVGIDINLKFRWVKKKKRIPFMPAIWLGAVFNMGSPDVRNGFRFYDPFVFPRIRSFQLRNIDSFYLGKK
jgi:hypothetical protein